MPLPVAEAAPVKARIGVIKSIKKYFTTEAQRARSFFYFNAVGVINNIIAFPLRSLCLCGEKIILVFSSFHALPPISGPVPAILFPATCGARLRRLKGAVMV